MHFTLPFPASIATFVLNYRRKLEKLPHVVFALILWLQVTHVSAQEQLTTMNQDAVMGSTPSNFFVYKDKLLFQAITVGHGMEPWVTDGTEDGTKMLKDINLGVSYSSMSKFVLFKDKVYFIAKNAANGYQLWVTDGTPDGTTMVSTSIVKLVSAIVANDDFIYFLKKDSKLELWKSDGTDQGTTIVKGDINIWNEASNLASAGGLIYFTCQPYGSNNTRVWRSDGTNAGTFPVTDELDGNGTHANGTTHPSQFEEFNGDIYFIARGGSFASPTSGLMKSDGTVAGTVAIKAMDPGSLFKFGESFVHNAKMYFTFFDVTNKRFVIWESDGTSQNTKVIFDNSYSHYFSPSSILADGNYFYFTIGNASSGTTLAQFNIQTKTLQSIKEIAGPINEPFIFTDLAIDFIVKGTTGAMYIGSHVTPFDDPELWISDGTTGGTQKVSSVSRARSIISFGNREFMAASPAVYEFELWTSVGTVSSTALFKDLNRGKYGLSYYKLIGDEDKALFIGRDESHGVEPWVTDGTAAGTTLLKDISTGSSSSYPENLSNSVNGFLFNGYDNNNYFGFQSDGTGGGTTVLTTFPRSSYFSLVKSIDGETFYFAVNNSNGTMSLYKHTIGQGAPVELKNFGFNIFNIGFIIREMVLTSSNIYLLIDAEGVDLWKSDGTQQGTVKVADFYEAHNLTSVANNVYFTSQDGFNSPIELFKSNGTAEGTMMVKDLNGGGSGEPLELTAFGNKLVFTAVDAMTGREAWISDGTVDGTQMLKDFYSGPVGGVPNAGFAVNGGNLYFTANDGTHGLELWKSDGTTENTIMFKDLLPGAESSTPNELKFHDGVLYFSAYTPAAGFEVWSSDGTESNTSILVDVLPGPAYSSPSKFLRIGDYLIFYALTPEAGMQLWSYKFEKTITGIEESLNSVLVYPNPSNGLFRVKHVGVQHNASVEIFALDGRRIGKMNNYGDDSVIDITQQPPGMYVIKIIDGENCTTTKVNKY